MRTDLQVALDGAPAFVAEAIEHLATALGESHPTVEAGRRLLAALAEIPDDAAVVTEGTLAAAIQRAFPARRNTRSNSSLTAATILAALRSNR